MRLLHKSPDQRYQSAAEVRAALAPAAAGRAVVAPAPARPLQAALADTPPAGATLTLAADSTTDQNAWLSPEPRRRTRAAPLVAGAVALLAAVIGGLWFSQRGGHNATTSENATITAAPPPPIASGGAPDASPPVTSADASPTAPPPVIVDAAPDVRPPPDAAVDHLAPVKVRFVSRPAGARVTVDGDYQCTTPCATRLPRSRRRRTATFERSGYKAATKKFSTRKRGTVRVRVTLKTTAKSPSDDLPPNDPPIEFILPSQD